jgi:DNA-binding MarR family transcriptional regulator
MTSVGGISRGRELRRPGLLAWLRLARVFQKVERVSGEHLRGWELSVAQCDVLAHVGASEGMTQQELADSLLVTKGNVCQLLDRMEDRGLISRRQEGRANRLFLTDEGRRLFGKVVPAHEAIISERFSVLSPKEQEQLHEVLRKLDRALG